VLGPAFDLEGVEPFVQVGLQQIRRFPGREVVPEFSEKGFHNFAPWRFVCNFFTAIEEKTSIY
jgi:hypothetical protein